MPMSRLAVSPRRARQLALAAVTAGGVAVLAPAATAIAAANSTGAMAPVKDTPRCCNVFTFPPIWITDFPGTLTPVQETGSVGKTFKATDGAYYVAVTPDGTEAYVTRRYSAVDERVVVPVNLRTRVAGQPIAIPGRATALAAGPRGKTVYVTTDNGALVLIDTATNAVRSKLTLGGTTPGLAISPNGTNAFVIVNDAVIPVDTRTLKPTPRIRLAPTPQAITITPNGRTVYVASSNGDVTPIAAATNTAGRAIALGGNASSIATTPDGVAVLVLNGTTVVPINVATNKPGRAVPIGDDPQRIVTTPDAALIPLAGSHEISSVIWSRTGRLRISSPLEIPGQVNDLAPVADQAPVARLAVRVAPAGNATTFDPTASTTTYGAIDHYRLDFGDGTHTTRSVTPGRPDHPRHVYAKAGTYTVRLTVVTEDGTSTQKVYTGQEMVLNGGPRATATKRILVAAG